MCLFLLLVDGRIVLVGFGFRRFLAFAIFFLDLGNGGLLYRLDVSATRNLARSINGDFGRWCPAKRT